MCTLGGKKLETFVLFKTRDPVLSMRFKDHVKRAPGKLFVANSDGYYCGINKQGVAVVCSVVKVGSRYAPYFIGNWIPSLLDARNAHELLSILQTLSGDPSGNLIIADPHTAYTVEVYGSQQIITPMKTNAVMTNHFIHIPKGPKKSHTSTFLRYTRLDKLLNSAGNITDIKTLLADHAHGMSEDSICRHGRKFTNSAFILDTKRGRLHYCKGHPCESPFRIYNVK